MSGYSITFLCWNVKKVKRHVYNSDVNTFCGKHDITSLTETWASKVTDYTDMLHSYMSVTIAESQVRDHRPHCSGGVLVFSQNDILRFCSRILPELKDMIAIKINKELLLICHHYSLKVAHVDSSTTYPPK